MYGFPGQIDYYRITVRVKCFNDNCDNVLVHTYPSYNDDPLIDGNCPKCGQGYSKKVSHITDRIIHREDEPVYF